MGEFADIFICVINALNTITPQAILFLLALCYMATIVFAIMCLFFLRTKKGK